ncbi:CBS domain-containing protein [Chitinimonas viridis]|uniref:CBS domain-containing protein n=2 Tax=Chitinimonas TaxID=240411 RepID=A0ABT8B2N6_9NEIS|nr:MULTISPECIES: CBS domain-containing protein [Chitinimonas]MBL8508783.1 CBS domain-containing protein [Chitinimonas sp.]MDN3575911.1 CBS domain-containing protein [Chitinimonas viridis]GLR14044.1 inosine-5-monophosphate dehydrogenase [Chitinimonas prasina]
MKTARQLLQEKSRQAIFSVPPTATVYQALQLMAEKDIGAVLVMEGEKLTGIFSERDYARKVVLQGKTSAGTPIVDIMTKRVMFALPSQTVDECMAIMSEKRFRHLPVMDGDKVIGVLSITDLVREQIAEQQFLIEQLEQYIHG